MLGRAAGPRARAGRGARHACGPAACAAPTSTSPKGTSRPARPGVVPGHEVVGVVDALGPAAHALPARRSQSASPGSATPAAGAASASAATRTCASRPASPGWDDDGGYAEYAVVDEAFAYADPATVRRRGGRAAAVRRASSATAPCGAPRCRRAAASASTGSAPRPTSPPRSRSHEGATVHVLTRSAEAQQLALELGAASAAGRRRRAARAARRGRALRAGRRARAGGAARPRPRRHVVDRRHPPQRPIPPIDYDHRAVRGASGAQRHRQHPPATARSCWPWRHAIPIRPTDDGLPVRAGRHEPSADLAHDRVNGAAVIRVS